MSTLNLIALLIVTYLAVFFSAYSNGLPQLLGARIDLLPALVVYAALRTGWATICLVAVCGALWFDTLSANPIGTSVLPLFLVGFTIRNCRAMVLRDEPYAQFVLGLIASAVVPCLTLVVLLSTGHHPLLGLGTLWQWFVMAMAGGILTPLFFWLFHRLHLALNYQPQPETIFRPDREIKRGRS